MPPLADMSGSWLLIVVVGVVGSRDTYSWYIHTYMRSHPKFKSVCIILAIITEYDTDDIFEDVEDSFHTYVFDHLLEGAFGGSTYMVE